MTAPDIDDIEQSFNFLQEANKHRKKALGYEFDQDKKLFKKIKNNFKNLLKENIPTKKIGHDILPIFILGMPRSGTSLIEKIISRKIFFFQCKKNDI